MTDPRLPEPVAKTEQGYKQVVNRLVLMRRNGRIPYGWISDSTRLGYYVTTYADPAEYLDEVIGRYRCDEWEHADSHVEVWCESRSLAGVVRRVCASKGVSLFPAGGFSSETFIYEAAQHIRQIGKPSVLLYLGDHDPAGVLIDEDIITKMRGHLGGVPVELRRLAITAAQIQQYSLPTKPRKAKDRRRLDITETVEAEAMPAGIIRELLAIAIDDYLEPDVRARVRASEAAQQQTMRELVSTGRRIGLWGQPHKPEADL